VRYLHLTCIQAYACYATCLTHCKFRGKYCTFTVFYLTFRLRFVAKENTEPHIWSQKLVLSQIKNILSSYWLMSLYVTDVICSILLKIISTEGFDDGTNISSLKLNKTIQFKYIKGTLWMLYIIKWCCFSKEVYRQMGTMCANKTNRGPLLPPTNPTHTQKSFGQ